MRDIVWEVSADSPYGEWFFQGKQDPISEAACSELWDVLWEVLHYCARHELFIHPLSLIKTCCSIAWAHAFLAALRIRSVCWLSRKQTMKSPSTISKVVCTLSDSHRGWEEGLIGMRRRSLNRVCHTPSPDTSLLLCKVFSDSEMRKKPIVQSAFRHFRGNFKCKLLLLQTETKHAIPFITTFWLFPSISLSMLIRSHEREKALEKNISTRSFFRES